MNSYMLIGLFTLTFVGQRALGFPAGGCAGGGIAADGHAAVDETAAGELEDGGFALQIGEEIVVPDFPISIETGLAYDFQIVSTTTDKTFGGALVRLQTDAHLSLNPGEGGNVHSAEVCVPPVVGSMHTDSSQKASFVGSWELLSEGSLNVDVMVLEENSAVGSTYWHGTYFLEVVDVLPDVPIGTSRLLQFNSSSSPAGSFATPSPSGFFTFAPTSATFPLPQPTAPVSAPPPPPPTPPTPPAPSPVTQPTPGTVVQETFDGVLLVFSGVREMGLGEISDFELITKDWFETFYLEFRNDANSTVAEDMQTFIRVTDQVVSVGQDGDLLMNEVTYQQEIVCTTQFNNFPPMTFITFPFSQAQANQEYADLLKSQIAAFEDLQSPIPTPQFTESDDGGNIGVIVGSVVGVGVFIAILVVAILIWRKKKSAVVGKENTAQPDAGGEIHSNTQPNAAAAENPSDIVAEEVPPSTILADAVLIEEDIQVPPAGADQRLPGFKDQARSVGKPPQDPQPLTDNQGLPQFKDQVRYVSQPRDQQPHTEARAPRARQVGLDP